MNDQTLPTTDDQRYRPFALIKRLLAEQGLVHWRKYAVAFVLMAVSASCTAMSAYLIGDVINQTYVNHNLTGVILAEMYASRDGIGHQIATWGENFQMKQLLAGVVMIAAIAITFNELVRWVETRCSHWRT